MSVGVGNPPTQYSLCVDTGLFERVANFTYMTDIVH